MLFSLIIEVFHVLQRVELSFQTPIQLQDTSASQSVMLCCVSGWSLVSRPTHAMATWITKSYRETPASNRAILAPTHTCHAAATGIGITCLTAHFSHSARAPWPDLSLVISSLAWWQSHFYLVLCSCLQKSTLVEFIWN